MPVVDYCAEEVRRQYYYESGSRIRERGLLATGWMLDAWAYVMSVHGDRPLTVGLIEHIGRLVEPRDNERGFRTIPIYVGGQEKAQPEDIERLLGQLVEAYNEGRLDPITYPGKSPEDQFYFEYENIHPFRDGNGRSGKILYNLLRGTLAAPQWPPRYWEGINP